MGETHAYTTMGENHSLYMYNESKRFACGHTQKPLHQITPHQLCHGNSPEDLRRVLLEGSARASKDASKSLEALLKPSMASATVDLAAVVVVVSLTSPSSSL